MNPLRLAKLFAVLCPSTVARYQQFLYIFDFPPFAENVTRRRPIKLLLSLSLCLVPLANGEISFFVRIHVARKVRPSRLKKFPTLENQACEKKRRLNVEQLTEGGV